MDSYNAPKLDADQALVEALNAAVPMEAVSNRVVNEKPIEVEAGPLPGEAIKRASESKETDGVPEWAIHMALGLAVRLAQLRSAAENDTIKVATPSGR